MNETSSNESLDKTMKLAYKAFGKPKELWLCKYCGENEKPKCHKCTREDGKLVTDELVED